MAVLAYGVVLMADVAASILILLQFKIFRKPAVQTVTLVILGIDGILLGVLVDKYFSMFLAIGIHGLLLSPIVFMLTRRIRLPALATGPDSCPEATAAERNSDWDRAFACYRDLYLPKQYHNRAVWQRLVGILRCWNNPDKCFDRLIALIQSAPKDAKLEYVFQCAELLNIGISSSSRARRLLMTVLPAFSPEERDRIQSRIAEIGAVMGRRKTLRYESSAGSFPEAEQAEQAGQWDAAFRIYRDTYLPRHYKDAVIWQRLSTILRFWADSERSSMELLELVTRAPSDEARIEYALQSADLLSVYLGSTVRARRLLEAIEPQIKNKKHQELLETKISGLRSVTDSDTFQFPVVQE